MRFLILGTDYPEFQNWLYAQHPGLEKQSYETQLRARAESLFSHMGLYSDNLKKLGHEADDIFLNNQHMQKMWAREHGLKLAPDWRWEFRLRRKIVPWVSRVWQPRWFYEILAAQIKHYKPDVLLTHAIHLSSTFFREMKPYFRLLVGSHSSPLPKEQDFGVYGLIVSAIDNLVDYFMRQGVKSELLRYAFEPAILQKLCKTDQSIPVSFVGNVYPGHASRGRWLESVCQRIPVNVWSPTLKELPDASRLNQGSAWGLEMFKILQSSRITINHHLDMAGEYAGNLRLFEATGVSTLLITDWKKNLHEMFEEGKEVVAYKTPDECVELIQYYLDHEDKRAKIARAGQEKTLKEHTYYQRMQQMVDIARRYL